MATVNQQSPGQGTDNPWPMRVGPLVLREAVADDIDRLLSFRNEPFVNRFMLLTSVDPDVFRDEWLAVPSSDTDFSCVAELDKVLIAMGFLDIVDGMGQPGFPAHHNRGCSCGLNPPVSSRLLAM